MVRVMGQARDAAAAAAMCPATAAGCVTAIACEARISTVRAPARRAMNCWASGRITWSAVAIRYQLGVVFHAAAPDFSSNAAAVMGRCPEAAAAPAALGTVAPRTYGDRPAPV